MIHQQKLESCNKNKDTDTVAVHTSDHQVELLERRNSAKHMLHMVGSHNLDDTYKSSYPHKHSANRSSKKNIYQAVRAMELLIKKKLYINTQKWYETIKI
jgi:hypothetical protein